MTRKQKIWLTLIFSILLLPWLLLGLVHLFAGDIQKVVIQQINQRLRVEVKVKTIQIEVFSGFPNISLHLQDVSIPSENGFKNPYLLKARDIDLRFSIWDVLNKNYRIQNIRTSGILICPEIRKDGLANFDILKPTKDTGKQEPLILDLSALHFRELEFKFSHAGIGQFIHFISPDLWLEGKLSEIESSWNMFGEANIKRYATGNLTFFENKRMLVDIQAMVNSQKSSVTITRGNLEAAQMKLKAKGQVRGTPKGMYWDIQLDGQDLTIPSMLSILPGDWSKPLIPYESNGELGFHAEMKGDWTSTSVPRSQLLFSISKGSLKAPEIQHAVQNINIRGEFLNPADPTWQKASLHISPFSFQIRGNQVQGDFTLTNWESPQVSGTFHGKLSLADLTHFFPEQGWKMSGQTSWNILLKSDINGSGPIAMQGKMQIDDAVIQAPAWPKALLISKSQILISPRSLEIQDAALSTGISNFVLNSHIKNWNPWTKQNPPMEAEVQFTSNECQLEDLLIFSALSNDSASGSENMKFRMRLNGFFKTLTYRETKADQVKMLADFTPDGINVRQLSAKIFGGKVHIDEATAFKIPKGYQITMLGEMTGIDISRMFKECRNFSQNYLTDKNLKGKADFKNLHLGVTLDSNWQIIPSSIAASSHISITQGVLKDFEPALALSKFAKVDDLKTLEFARLENQISILGEKVIIPDMEVKSNALSLSVSGTHTFENNMDYFIRLKLSDILLNKWRSKNVNLEDELKLDEKKGVYLHFHLTGIPPDIKVAYDRKGGQQQMKKQLLEEKKEVKESIRQSLGPLNNPNLNPEKHDSTEVEPLIFE